MKKRLYLSSDGNIFNFATDQNPFGWLGSTFWSLFPELENRTSGYYTCTITKNKRGCFEVVPYPIENPRPGVFCLINKKTNLYSHHICEEGLAILPNLGHFFDITIKKD